MRRPIKKRELLALIQEFTAVDAVAPSAVRGQPRGTAAVIRRYLTKMDLGRIPRGSRQDLARWLNLHTRGIQRNLPNRKKPWGVARKTLNLFLRSCFYNHDLRKAYGMANVGRWLEVPLDGVVARELRRDAGRGKLPQWRGLGGLTPEDSEAFQRHARLYAAACKLPATVFLDNYLWLQGRRRQTANKSRHLGMPHPSAVPEEASARSVRKAPNMLGAGAWTQTIGPICPEGA